MKIIIVKNNDGTEKEKYLFDLKKDNCPLCDTPLKETFGTWNMFHGEVSRSCCNSNWQTKDFYVDDDELGNYKEYFTELNKPNINSLSIPKHLWQPLRDAYKKYGIKDCKNDQVYEEIKPLI